jgi:hypothetical protein
MQLGHGPRVKCAELPGIGFSRSQLRVFARRKLPSQIEHHDMKGQTEPRNISQRFILLTPVVGVLPLSIDSADA